MHNARILVVDDHHSLRGSMAEYLRQQEGIEMVREAENGVEALKCLTAESFDVIVTDLVMPKMDGYMLLAEMRKCQIATNAKVIVASALSGTEFVTRAVELGASFYLVKPYEHRYLLEHILDLTGRRDKAVMPSAQKAERQSLDERLGNLFMTIGIPPHIKGYQFLRQAVKLVIDKPEMINHITKELYPSIAQHFDTSSSKVERAIRHAIEVAWNRGRVDEVNAIFGCRVCTQEEKPTNGEFIAMIADKLATEMRSA